MDEHKLADAFRDAVREVPPPSFNEQDVVTASQRASARQRRLVLGGSTFGAALLLGGTVLVTSMLGSQPGVATNTASGEVTAEGSVLNNGGQSPNTADQFSPGTQRNQPPQTSSDPSKQGGGSASTGPSIGGTEGCGMADRKLAAALAVELPAVAASTPEQAPGDICPQGSRGVALRLPEGTLVVVLTPGDGTMARSGQAFTGPNGSQGYTMPTAKGDPLSIHSIPRKPGAPAPYAGDLERVTKKLSEVFQ